MKRILKDRHTSLIILSTIIGALAGLANIVFRSTVHLVHEIFFVGGSEFLHIADGGFYRLLLPLIPMAGAALLIPLAMIFPGEVKGYTFHRFLEHVNLKGGVLKARTLLTKTLGPAITIGTGGSAGVEGPIATVGGTIGSLIGQGLKVSGNRMKLLIAAGAAGAVGATFNAPIAGVMFALEIVLLGNYELNSFAAIVVSSGIATVVSRAYYGPTPAFSVPQYDIVSPYEIPLYIILGLIIGVLAVVYIRVFYKAKDMFSAAPIPESLRLLLGAFMVGCIGIFLPHVLGDGYMAIEDTLADKLPFYIIFLMIIFKILATAITLGSGGTGGVFAPSLFIGAMIGGSFGHLVNKIIPDITAAPGAYATVGIGAFLAAATHAPLTGIFLLFEMTGNYQIIVPVMFSAIIGTIVSRRLCPDSIDTVELTRNGINIHAGREVTTMSKIKVRDAMTTDFMTVHKDLPLTSIVEIMINTEKFYLPVVDDNDSMVGIISIQDVRPVLFEEAVKGIVKAGELATENVITLTPDDDLNTAMENFSQKDIDEIPVVSHIDNNRIVGMLKRMDVISTYKKAVLRADTGNKF